MTAPDSPMPLVTLTLTTDEVAMASAGLLLLLRHWNRFAESDPIAVTVTMRRIGAFRQRLDESVSEEQGRALFQDLLNELKRKGGSNG